MKEIKEAQMGMIAILTVMLVSITRRLPTRRFSSGITTLALAGIVLLVAAGGVSAADCSNAIGGPGSCNCGDTVVGDYTFTGNMVCTDGTTYGLLVGASDITIDGAGYSMTGAKSESVCNVGIMGGAPSEQNPAKHSGIVNREFDNVVIKNVEITGFCTGIGLGDMIYNNVDDNTVIDCNIHECGDPARITHGIHMVHTRTCDIMKNEISYIDGTGAGSGCSGGGNGIFMYGENSGERGWYNNFTCNYLHNNNKSGFFMKHMCQYCIISYNNATENAEGGIVPMCKQSKHTEIKYNNISNNVQVGYRSQGGDNDLMFNTIMNNGPIGIDIISCADCGTNTVITNNTVCEHTKDIQVGVPAENTGDSNTCGSTDIDGACDWNCDNKVSAYFDFDNDGYYSDDPVNCACGVAGSGKCACCNPGEFHSDHANLLKSVGICVLSGDTHDDPNDCDNSILGAQKSDYIVTAVGITWLDDAQYNVTYTVKNDGDAAATVESNTSITVDASIIEVITPGLAKDATSNGEVGPFSCSDLSDGVTVCADCNNVIDEISESNNCDSTTMVTCKLPDYRIIDKYETWIDESAGTYNITYLICNNGTRDGTQNTTTKVDTGVTGQPDTNVPPIPQGTCKWRVAQHSGAERVYTMSGSYDEITLTANRGSGTMPELDTSNNAITNTFYRGVVVAIDPCPVTIGSDPSDRTTVDITLSNIADYGSGTIHLYFDTTYVDIVSIGEGDSTGLYSNKQTDGHYKISASNTNGLDGDVVFANVTFKPMGPTSGCSYLNLVVETLYDRSFAPLDTVVNNCTISIGEPNIPGVTTPTACPTRILNDNGRARASGTNLSTLSVWVTDDTEVDTVTINLTPIRGAGYEAVPMTRTSGNKQAGTWSVETNATCGVNLTHCLAVNATDVYGNSHTANCVTLEVLRRGDIDPENNIVDIGDYNEIAKYTVGLRSMPDEFTAGTVPADSHNGVDMADALYIAMYTVVPGYQAP